MNFWIIWKEILNFEKPVTDKYLTRSIGQNLCTVPICYYIHLIPMQILLPSPKGIVENGWRWALASEVNLEGSNLMGSGKRVGSRENANVGIITAVSLGRIDPFGNR